MNFSAHPRIAVGDGRGEIGRVAAAAATGEILVALTVERAFALSKIAIGKIVAKVEEMLQEVGDRQAEYQ